MQKKTKLLDFKIEEIGFITKYERSKVLGIRAMQLAKGSPSTIDTFGLEDVMDIAKMELIQNKLPIEIIRKYPNGTSISHSVTNRVTDKFENVDELYDEIQRKLVHFEGRPTYNAMYYIISLLNMVGYNVPFTQNDEEFCVNVRNALEEVDHFEIVEFEKQVTSHKFEEAYEIPTNLYQNTKKSKKKKITEDDDIYDIDYEISDESERDSDQGSETRTREDSEENSGPESEEEVIEYDDDVSDYSD